MQIDLFFRKLLEKIALYLNKGAKYIYCFPQEKRVVDWFAVQGDKTLRLNYDLNEFSIVFDLGGFEGQWTSDIFSMYCCKIHVFEPVKTFADKIEKRFIKNTKIIVHQFGLSNVNKETEIFIDADSSSAFKGKISSEDIEDINLVKAIDFIKNHNIKYIDLIKINIEGGEYDLLEHLIESGFIQNINNIQVQFHDFMPDAVMKMANIQEELSKTHFLTYQYPFVWENWKKNDCKSPR
ncbi:FkbM family methyltransferase [Synechocystis sp. FACHB-383]|uniref:FkbM family methyltransferase n=1 Tax=Synechocystis sp. FACHB-383 TaxID=2692864 RepID=UPI00168508E3|nr:FkbM family methyltransferase [Synechocystis sp. FACHB-383]MBD2655389.1 FkbM family methyltransferase [Synechocystis sp. FACHB-383]